MFFQRSIAQGTQHAAPKGQVRVALKQFSGVAEDLGHAFVHGHSDCEGVAVIAICGDDVVMIPEEGNGSDGDGFLCTADCDDTNAGVSPNAAEECFDLIDNDCDSLVDTLNPDVLPTGRNMHGFDPFRLPSRFACQQGAAQAEQLIARHVAGGAPFPRV